MDSKDIQINNTELSRRASVTATLASNASRTPSLKDNIQLGDRSPKEHDSSSEHTIAEQNSSEDKPKRKNNLWVTFSGLQIALFLAALDR